MDIQEKIKRPKNAYLLFSNDRRPAMKKMYPNATNIEIFEKIGHEWNQLPLAEKEKYFTQAKLLKIEHQQKYPDYVYTPRRRMALSPNINVTTTSQKTIEDMRQEALAEYENLKREYQYLGTLKVKQKIKIYETALKHQDAIAEYKAMAQLYEQLAQYQTKPKQLLKQVKHGKILVSPLSGSKVQTQISHQSKSSSNSCHGDLLPCQSRNACKAHENIGKDKQKMILKKQTIARRDLLQNYIKKVKHQKQLQGPKLANKNIQAVQNKTVTDDDHGPFEGGLSKMVKRIQSNLPICTSVGNTVVSNMGTTNTLADYNIFSDVFTKYSVLVTTNSMVRDECNKNLSLNYSMVCSGLNKLASVPVNNDMVSYSSKHDKLSPSLTSTNLPRREIITQKSPINSMLLSTCDRNQDTKPLTQTVAPGGFQNHVTSNDSPCVLVPVAFNTNPLCGLSSMCNIPPKQMDSKSSEYRHLSTLIRESVSVPEMTDSYPKKMMSISSKVRTDSEIMRDVDVMNYRLPTKTHSRKRKHTVLKDGTYWPLGEVIIKNIQDKASTDSDKTSKLIPTETMKLPTIVVDYPTNH